MLNVRLVILLAALSAGLAAQTPNLSLTPLYPGCSATLTITGAPNAPFVLGADVGPGPVFIAGLGQVDLDLGPGLFFVIDGLTDNVFLDGAGNFSLEFVVPLMPAGSLPTAPIYLQALVFDPGGPTLSNGIAASINSAPPAPYTNGVLPPEAFIAEDSEFADLDNDGDLDAVIANNGSLSSRIYINQGGLQGGTVGDLQDETVARTSGALTGALTVAIADVEGDGDLDIFLGADDLGGVNTANTLWLNQGGNQGGVIGTFLADGFFPGGAYETQAACFVDLDGNGFPDLYCGNGVDVANAPEPDELWLNFQGVFLPQSTLTGAAWNQGGETDDVVAGFLDADANADLVLVRDGMDHVLLGDGQGGFTEAVNALPGAMFNSTSGAIADFDGDGNPDVFLSNIGAPDQIFFGDGTGSFMPGTLPFAPTSTLHLGSTAGDVDGDGDIDIAVATHALGGGELPYIYVNQGGSHAGTQGTFFAQLLLTAPSEIFAAVSMADVDADGDVDLYLASQGFFGPTAQDVLLLSGLCP